MYKVGKLEVNSWTFSYFSRLWSIYNIKHGRREDIQLLFIDQHMCDNFPKCSSELFFDDIKNMRANWMKNCIKELDPRIFNKSLWLIISSEYIDIIYQNKRIPLCPTLTTYICSICILTYLHQHIARHNSREFLSPKNKKNLLLITK